MPTPDVAVIVRTLIAALPDACLRDLCLQLVFNSLATPPPAIAEPEAVKPEARRKGGWPRGRPRGTAGNGRRRRAKASGKGSVDPKLAARRARYVAKRAAARKAARHAAKAAKTAEAPQPTADNGNGKTTPVTAQAFWQRCEQIEPGAPWRVPMREFDVRNTVAQQAFRARTLPPRIGAMALNKFLELRT
jgi:hypothetical protein